MFVLNLSRVRSLESWKNGTHTIINPPAFCPRCLEFLPPVGVHRLITDSGDILSGDVVISGGYGTTLQLLVSPSGVVYTEVNFVGDPIYTATHSPGLPIQQVVCTDMLDGRIILRGDESQNISIVASNVYEPLDYDDALRIEGYDSTARVSLGGK